MYAVYRSARSPRQMVQGTYDRELLPTLSTVHKLSNPLERLRSNLRPSPGRRRLLDRSSGLGSVCIQIVRVNTGRSGSLCWAGFLLLFIGRKGQFI